MSNPKNDTTVLARSGDPSPWRQATDAGQSCLVMLYPPGPEIGRRLQLRPGTYVVGRDAGVQIELPSHLVSRQHARVSVDEQDVWQVHDLASTNGTFVNEERIDSRRLADGDRVRFGDVIYKFLGGSNVESSYHEEIYRLTILDGLTGVHNKRYFLEFLAREVAVVHRYGHPLTLVLLDVDHFKAINDKWGHLAGDAVLKDYAYRVGTRIRREDLFARCGGEEFACVLPSTALTGGVVFAEALRRLASDRPTVFGTEPIPFTVSLGVASMDGASGGDVTDLLKRADDNMYAAKRAGRNRVVP